MKLYQTTSKHYQFFKDECSKWIKFWGLIDWRVFYEHIQIDAYGSCSCDSPGKICTIQFSTKWDEPITEEGIKRVAFHEISEMLIGPLFSLSLSRFVTRNEIAEASHSIIRRLENCIFTNKDINKNG